MFGRVKVKMKRRRHEVEVARQVKGSPQLAFTGLEDNEMSV